MRKSISSALLAGLLLVGCGKKNDPEDASGPAVSTDIVRVVMIRSNAKDNIEHSTVRGVVSVTNGHSGAITLKKAVYTGYVGGRPSDQTTEELGFTVEPGASSEIRLDAPIDWKNDAEIAAKRGRISGTLYYRGPNGGNRSVPFELQSELVVRGQ